MQSGSVTASKASFLPYTSKCILFHLKIQISSWKFDLSHMFDWYFEFRSGITVIWTCLNNFFLLALLSYIYFQWFVISWTSLLDMQGTLRDLSKGGRSVSMDQTEPVCTVVMIKIFCFSLFYFYVEAKPM